METMRSPHTLRVSCVVGEGSGPRPAVDPARFRAIKAEGDGAVPPISLFARV